MIMHFYRHKLEWPVVTPPLLTIRNWASGKVAATSRPFATGTIGPWPAQLYHGSSPC
jgi:hypothetical protein